MSPQPSTKKARATHSENLLAINANRRSYESGLKSSIPTPAKTPSSSREIASRGK